MELRAKLRSDGHRPLEADDVHRLCAVVQPENRRAFEVVPSTFSVPGRFSAAILSLACALSLVVEAGASQSVDDETVWSQARPFTDEELRPAAGPESRVDWSPMTPTPAD